MDRNRITFIAKISLIIVVFMLGAGMGTYQFFARDLPSWYEGQQFDRILLDAPCTATGVIRRHPDIKLHRHRAARGGQGAS